MHCQLDNRWPSSKRDLNSEENFCYYLPNYFFFFLGMNPDFQTLSFIMGLKDLLLCWGGYWWCIVLFVSCVWKSGFSVLQAAFAGQNLTAQRFLWSPCFADGHLFCSSCLQLRRLSSSGWIFCMVPLVLMLSIAVACEASFVSLVLFLVFFFPCDSL